jgi:hypothetical protein
MFLSWPNFLPYPILLEGEAISRCIVGIFFHLYTTPHQLLSAYANSLRGGIFVCFSFLSPRLIAGRTVK